MLADIFPTGWHSTRLADLKPGESIVIYRAVGWRHFCGLRRLAERRVDSKVCFRGFECTAIPRRSLTLLRKRRSQTGRGSFVITSSRMPRCVNAVRAFSADCRAEDAPFQTDSAYLAAPFVSHRTWSPASKT
jgi:hypothetical protein